MKYLALFALLGCTELFCSERTKNLKEEVYNTVLNASVITPHFILELENHCKDPTTQEWIDIFKTLGTLTENRSGILFPAFSKSLDSGNKIDVEATRLNKKRDEAILMNLWSYSFVHHDLLAFIKMRHTNFERTYGTTFDILEHGKKSNTLQKLIEEYDDSPHAELFNELQPRKSHLVRNFLFLSILGGLVYLARTCLASQKNSSDDQLSTNTLRTDTTSRPVTHH